MPSLITSEPIPDTIRAVVLESPRRLVPREIPQWPLADYGDPDLVLVKVKACGVCGSDFRYYEGENPWAQHTLGRHVDNPPNIVMGHEFAGEVVAVLAERNKGLLGQRVAPVCSKYCGRCDECRAGRTELCPNTMHLGHGAGWGQRPFYPGAYAQYVPAWAASCYPIPESVSFEEAAMMDILAVCVHVAHRGRIQPGRPVLMMGAGPAGNGIAQAARYLGASRVVITDLAETALEHARAQGIDCVLDVRGKSPNEVAAEALAIAPEGFGSVFDSVGSRESLDTGLQCLGRAGTLVNMAVHDEAIPLNLMRLGSERSITTSCNFADGDYPHALAWLESGRFQVKDWLTRVTLDEIPARFEEVLSHKSARSAFKMVITG